MRRVLLVSPRFPPKSAPELHRARTSLAYYRQFGWEPTVLCVSPQTADGVDEPPLAEALPADMNVVSADAWPETTCRRFGFGQLAYRCIGPLHRAGTAVLERQKHDVVMFSTTVFLTFALGPLWKRRFGCKLVYDFQDPWYAGKPLPYDSSNVPGSWWKYRLDQWLAGHLERYAMAAADHVVSVSQAYVDVLSRRYPRLARDDFTVIPFGADRRDYEFVRTHAVVAPNLSAGGRFHIVAAGRAGRPGSDPVLHAFFSVLAESRKCVSASDKPVHLSFVGTSYASDDRAVEAIMPLAREHGVADLVEEQPLRIPYYSSLALYDASDAILIFGTASADYTASKLFSCVLSGKPVLAMVHRDSLLSQIAANIPSVFLATFGDSSQEPKFRARIKEGLAWLRTAKPDTSRFDEELRPWSAEELTRLQCAIFDRVCDSDAGAGNRAALT